MSTWNVPRVDKRIIRHIGSGGSIRDPQGRALVAELVGEAIKDKKIATACMRYGLQKSELELIYTEMLESLGHNCATTMGGVIILIPSLVFTDDDRFPALAELLGGGSQPSAPDRLDGLQFGASSVGEMIANKARDMNKLLTMQDVQKFASKASAQPTQSGCASLIILSFILAGTLIIIKIKWS